MGGHHWVIRGVGENWQTTTISSAAYQGVGAHETTQMVLLVFDTQPSREIYVAQLFLASGMVDKQ